MRLFIAIRPDKTVLSALGAAQTALKNAGVTGNYTKPWNLHITLAFIGEYPDPAKVLRAMKSVPFTPLDISVEGTGCFKGVVWAGIKDNGALADHALKLRGALAENGVPFDKKPFSPHITLVREPRGELPRDILPRSGMTAQKISLFKSERGINGVIYTEIGYNK